MDSDPSQMAICMDRKGSAHHASSAGKVVARRAVALAWQSRCSEVVKAAIHQAGAPPPWHSKLQRAGTAAHSHHQDSTILIDRLTGSGSCMGQQAEMCSAGHSSVGAGAACAGKGSAHQKDCTQVHN